MKKTLRTIIIFLVCTFVICGVAQASENIRVNCDMSIMVNGQAFVPCDTNGRQVMVMEYKGTTYVPLRALAEAFGLTVGYDSEKRMATVERLSTAPEITPLREAVEFPDSIDITVNTDMSILVNGQQFIPKDASGNVVDILEYNGTTYAPLRALAEAYGLSVGYNAEKRMAEVTDQGQIVYVTKTGKRYHYDNNCNGGTYYESTMEEALARNLTPCEKCVK